jgi:hypothetical protein
MRLWLRDNSKYRDSGIGRLTLVDDRRFARLGFSLADNLEIISKKKIDNRRAPRRPYDASAWIRLEGSFTTQQCQILDRSETGVGLAIADAYRIPNKFMLLLFKNGPGRRASIRWRRSSRIGAEFVSAGDLGPNYSARIADNVAKLRKLLGH